MRNNNKIVIAGFGGVGKTYCGKKYANVKDVESSAFKYDYSKIENPDYEKLKGDRTRILNKDFPQNYINAVKLAQKDYDIVTIWCCDEMFKIYQENGIDFCICYPSKADFKKNYIQRYLARGNTQQWIDGAIAYYEKIVAVTKNMSVKKIVLHNNETLEDWLLKNNYQLKL